MAYTKTKYNDIDLMLKGNRSVGAKDDVIGYFQKAYVDLGGPPVKTSSGAIRPMLVDKAFGTQTKNGLLVFQEACGIPTTGVLDQKTYFYLDWSVFGVLNGAWSHAKVSGNSMGAGGPAIIRGNDGYAYNGLVIQFDGKPFLVPVNSQGASRESSRLSRVNEARIGKLLGYNGSVLRSQVGSDNDSSHSHARSGDDMGDQNKNRIIEGDEMLMLKASWDYYYMRAIALGEKPVKHTYVAKRIHNHNILKTYTVYSIGHDLLTSEVLGNLRYPGEKRELMFPGKRYFKDMARTWSPNRGFLVRPGDVKALSGSFHAAPFHLHTDSIWGAPAHGGPF